MTNNTAEYNNPCIINFRNAINLECPSFPENCSFYHISDAVTGETIDTITMEEVTQDAYKAISRLHNALNARYEKFVLTLSRATNESERFFDEYITFIDDFTALHMDKEGDHVRVVSADKEIMYWQADEFTEDAAEVMGAVIGLLK